MQIIYILNLIEAKYDIKQTIFVIFRCKTKVLNCYIYSFYRIILHVHGWVKTMKKGLFGVC